jgi:hypothetical protein
MPGGATGLTESEISLKIFQAACPHAAFLRSFNRLLWARVGIGHIFPPLHLKYA